MPQQTQPPAPVDDVDTDDTDTTVSAAERKARREAKALRDRLKASDDARAALEQRMAGYEQSAAEAATLKAQMDALAAVFNPQGDEPVDPAKLAEQLAAEKATAEAEAAKALADRDAQLRSLRVEQAAERAARAAGVEAEALLDSRTFRATVDKLDPSSETFKADLASAIEAAVAANPKLKVAPVATRSGAEIAGRSGATDQITDRAKIASMSPEEIAKATADGRFSRLLGGS